MTNRLAQEKSPYLLQHADNPVDWYAWGPEAFEKATREDKPVFLSIGYATCHWCHVMVHESFEDEAVAALMNDAFVNVKVDREERPDVDHVYMTACQLVSGHGGWPLTVIMTPDKEPFFVGTYLPRESRFGRIGMMELVPRIRQAWQDDRGRVAEAAGQIVAALQQETQQHAPSPTAPGEEALRSAYAQLAQRYDAEHGGFGSAPKFPSPHNLLFLLRYAHRSGDARARDMALDTLRHMRRGGLFDHLGYGFHRYATDRTWLLPHFEKMLYDQAMLLWAYTDAYADSGEAFFADTAREIVTYVQRDLGAPDGAFFAAEDADSEGREGKFYVWTTEEVAEVLDAEAAALVTDVYHVEPRGNFEEEATRARTGENILHLRRPLPEEAQARGLPEDALRTRLAAARRQLFDHRAHRVRPGLDDKILTDWNGLMIAALARAARALGEPAYAEAAERAIAFLLDTLRTDDGRLLHRYRDGEAGIGAHLDDYIFLALGLLECYETTFRVAHLTDARALIDAALEHFWDAEAGAFFFTPDDGEALLVRQKMLYDGAVPSGNSLAVTVLLRLARLTGATRYETHADAIARYAGAQVKAAPAGFTGLLLGLDFGLGPAHEVVIAGRPGAADTEAMVQALHGAYLPNTVMLLRPPDAPDLVREAPFTEPLTMRDGQATAYVCRSFQCEAPVTDPQAMMALLQAGVGNS